jgi:hypothetical protein
MISDLKEGLYVDMKTRAQEIEKLGDVGFL